MAEAPSLQLVYLGRDVTGTVTVADILGALEGFLGACAKVSGRDVRDLERYVRISSLGGESAQISLDNEAVGLNAAMSNDLVSIIEAKKHLAGVDATAAQIHVAGSTVALLNGKNRPYEMTERRFSLLKAHVIDADLDKITAPLAETKVNGLELRLAGEVVASVSWMERVFFDAEKSSTRNREDIWIEGVLESLSKASCQGFLCTSSGRRIRYKYIGKNLTRLLQAFVHQGVVRVRGKGTFNKSRDLVSMQIVEVEVAGTADCPQSGSE